MQNYEYKFEVKPGRWVYLPTDNARLVGERIRDSVLKRWKPDPVFYHLLRRGGHVVALKRHTAHRFLGKRDINNFFSAITRTKVARALRQVGFSAREAFTMAEQSVVVSDHGKHLPYGFVQSMALATLALQKSAIGTVLRNIPNNVGEVTVYVDDILYSSNDEEGIIQYGEELDQAAMVSNISFNEEKNVTCQNQIEAFNCLVGNGNLELTDHRIGEFLKRIKESETDTNAVLKYVDAINQDQMRELAHSIGIDP